MDKSLFHIGLLSVRGRRFLLIEDVFRAVHKSVFGHFNGEPPPAKSVVYHLVVSRSVVGSNMKAINTKAKIKFGWNLL